MDSDSDMIKEHIVRRQNEQSVKTNQDELQIAIPLAKVPSTDSDSTQTSEEAKSRPPVLSAHPVNDKRVTNTHLTNHAMQLSKLKTASPVVPLSHLRLPKQ